MANDILVKVGADITDFSRKMKESNQALKGFADANKETFDAFKKTGTLVTGVGIALTAGLGKAVKVTADFEASMSRVGALSGATEKEMNQLTQTAKDLGASTVFSASEAAEGMTYLAMAGFNTNDVIEAMPALLNTAAAGQLELGTAADITSNILSGFGIAAEDTARVADVLTATFTSSNTTMESLGESMKMVAPTANALGLSIEEVSAAVGLLGDAGIQGSMAGSQLSMALTRLSSPAAAAADVMEELGFSAFDSSGQMKPLEDIIRELTDSTSHLTEEQRMHAISTIFGAQSMKSILTLMESGADTLGKFTSELENSGGVAEEIADKQLDNFNGQIVMLKSAMEGAAISIGSALLPALKVLVGIVQGAVDWFNGLSDGMKSTIAITLGIAAALALVAGPILLLIGFIPSIIAGFAALKAVFVAVTAAILSPVTLIIAGIAALIAAVIWAYNQFDWFRDAVLVVWEWIKTSVLAVFDVIKEAISMALEFIMSIWEEHGESLLNIVTTIWEGIKDAIDAVISFIQEIVENILGKVSEFWEDHGEFITKVTKKVWDTIKQVVKLSLDVIREYISLVLNAIKNVFEVVWPIISGVVKTAWGLIKTFVKNALDVVSGIINTVMNLIKGDWKGAWNSIKETATNIMNNIIDFFKGIDLYQIGKDVIDGLINGIKSMVGKVSDAVKSVTSKITGTVKKILGIKSPSRVLAEIGRWTGEGLVIGIEGMTNNVAKAAGGLALAAIPDERQIDLSYATPTGIQSSLSSAINGTVDVNSREDLIAGAIANLERRLDGMQVVMEGETVGRIVAPTVSETISEQSSQETRGRGRRRL